MTGTAYPQGPQPSPVLSVRELRVTFRTDDGVMRAVDGVSFEIFENEVVAVVGESGAGKSVTALAVLGLLPRTARVGGEVVYRGRSILGLRDKELRQLRGAKIAMVFQDALSALNPVLKVGDQIAEAIAVHRDLPAGQRRTRVVELLDLVGIPDPATRADQYPHELSGGMRQRALIAMAIANDPDVVIADEPTTALDVTIQAQVLEVLRRIQDRTRSAILLITHDLGVVAGTADRVMVMYAGRSVEQARIDDLFYCPRHPYTVGLLASLPRLDADRRRRLSPIAGQPPSVVDVPSGCAFHPRCSVARLPTPCQTEVPTLRLVDHPEHWSRCHFAEELRRVTSPGALRVREAGQ